MTKYQAKIEKDGKGYAVSFPDLPGCFSYGSTLEEAKKNAVEALDLYIEGSVSDLNEPNSCVTNKQGSNYYWISSSK